MAQYNFDNIPQELRQCEQWILWRKEMRGDKLSKVPYQLNGQRAATDKPQHFLSFSNVVRAYNVGRFDGIGFVFTKSDPYIGIDIDHCIADNGAYSDMAQDIILHLDSYTERSPSGDGLHIIIKGELPDRITGSGKKNPANGLEIYRHTRYFTFTGDAVHNTDVQERTDEIKAIFNTYIPDKPARHKQRVTRSSQGQEFSALKSDSELLDEMFNGKNGAAIKKLWEGHIERGDHSGADLSLCNHLARYTDRDTARMDALFRQSGLMRDKWDSARGDSTYGADTIQKAADECVMTISEYKEQKRQERQSAQQQKSDAQVTASARVEFNLTELGNAERIKHHEGHRLKYCKGLGWLIWNGKKWANDETDQVEIIAANTFRQIYKEAYNARDEEQQKEMLKWAKRCESRKVMENSVKTLRPRAAIQKKELDKHEMLFNCSNGVIDLTTGELMPHHKELYLTQIADVEYNPHAECPTWNRFLDEIIVDKSGKTDKETIRYLQKAFGYALTGSTKEQCMFFFHGGGKNGKSTLVATLREVMGDYGKQADSSTFIKKKHEGVNNDVAMLDGKRFVAVSESEEGQQLDESLVKQLTGGDKITARFLYQEHFEFMPAFKIFFSTNHKPIIKNDDSGIWRRVHLIPFNAHIPPKNRDFDLPEKLRAEVEGILAWMVQGALMWKKEGLEQPKMVEQSTREYREEMDMIGPFINEVCIQNPAIRVEAKKLFREYENWCYKNSETAYSNRKFYRMLNTKGFKKDRGTDNKNFVFGLGLKEEHIGLAYTSKSNSKDNKSNFESKKSNSPSEFIPVDWND